MRGNVSCLSIACTSPFSFFLSRACQSSASVFLKYLSYFLLPSFPNNHRANSERLAGTQWNGHWLLPEPLWRSPEQPHPQPLRHTAHAPQPHAHTSATPRKPQLPALEGTLSAWLWQRAGIQATFSQLSTNGPPSVSVCVQLDTEMLRWRDSHSSTGSCSLWLPHTHSFCGPEGGRGGKSVPHTSDHSPILFSYRTDHSNCCPASLWTSWSGT